MAVVLLIRHATTSATGRTLYGRARGIHLDGRGQEQAARLAERLRPIPLAAVYSSPLERCVETAEEVAAGRRLDVRTHDGLLETDIGDLAGRTLRQVARTRFWRTVQRAPSRAAFPGGESFVEATRRVTDAIEAIAARHAERVVAVCSHADPIRLAIAHYAGIHLDHFQRLVVHPASVSVIALVGEPRVVAVNDTGDLAEALASLRSPRPGRRRGGGGAPTGPRRSARGVGG